VLKGAQHVDGKRYDVVSGKRKDSHYATVFMYQCCFSSPKHKQAEQDMLMTGIK
jgi:hypothetical protein